MASASLLQKLLRRSPRLPALRILASLTKPPHLPEPSPLPPQNPIPRTNPMPIPTPSYLPNGAAGGKPPPSHHPIHIYPQFPLFFHPESIPLPGLVESDAEHSSGDAAGDGTVWADSVKKKRKRKMNKHKYRKLRKRLRRKT